VADRNVLRVTLEYTDINWLFSQPDVSPFSANFHEYSTTPGIEFICNELYANPSLKRVETTILLPPDEITPDLEQQTREAIRRYCLARSQEMRQDERALRWRALRALAFAVGFFVVWIAVEKPLMDRGTYFFDLLGEGLSILVWVAFWFPLDALVFGVRYHSLDAESYRRVSEMQLTIKPAVGQEAQQEFPNQDGTPP
jgi:hypothetical protein